MCEDDDDLGKTPGRAPIGQEELGFFSTLKVDDDHDEKPRESRSGIAEPSASGWAEVDAQQSVPATGSRRVMFVVIALIALTSLVACAWLLLAGGR
jgi:hypothetical protein